MMEDLTWIIFFLTHWLVGVGVFFFFWWECKYICFVG
jgi:hypothetical protein